MPIVFIMGGEIKPAEHSFRDPSNVRKPIGAEWDAGYEDTEGTTSRESDSRGDSFSGRKPEKESQKETWPVRKFGQFYSWLSKKAKEHLH